MPKENGKGECGGEASSAASGTSSGAKRRLRTLRSHLTGAVGAAAQAESALRNVRPGDEDLESAGVETSYFVKGAFTPRPDECAPGTKFSLGSATVEGSVPEDLVGAFMRIGPNPRFDFRGKPYHVFDGDGMVHAVSLPRAERKGDREATYANRWVRTRALEKDDAQGF